MRTVLGTLGALVIAVSAVYYAVDIVRGTTRPQRTSWGVWALVGILGVGTSVDGGAGPGAWAAGVDALACASTFLLSLHPRFGKPGRHRLDPVLAAVAVTGVVLWRWGPLGDAGAALLAVGCETIALWPTVRDGWRQPHTESLTSWAVDVVGNALCLSAATATSVAALAYPLYVLGAAVTMTCVLLLRRGAGSVTGTPAPPVAAALAAASPPPA